MQDNLSILFEKQDKSTLLQHVKGKTELIMQLIDLIQNALKNSAKNEIYIFSFKVLNSLVKSYNIPVVLAIHNETFLNLFDQALKKGHEAPVIKLICRCLNIFSFDPNRESIALFAQFYNNVFSSVDYPTEKEYCNTPFASFFQKCQSLQTLISEVNDLSQLNFIKQDIDEIANQDGTLAVNDFNGLEYDMALTLYENLIKLFNEVQSSLKKPMKSPKEYLDSTPNKVEKPKIKTEKLDDDPRFKTFFVLGEVLQSDESENNEYKDYFYPLQSAPGSKIDAVYVLKKVINGFLNTQGGRIFIGVNDDRKVKGILLLSKQRDEIKLQIQHFINDFSPAVSPDRIKVMFLPIKNHQNKVIKGKFVVKIIVKQGDPTQLYSLNKEKFQAFYRIDGGVKPLNVERITQEIKQRSQGLNQTVDPKLFEDPKPDPIEDLFRRQELPENVRTKLTDTLLIRKPSNEANQIGKDGKVYSVRLTVPQGFGWFEVLTICNPNKKYKSYLRSKIDEDANRKTTGNAIIYFRDSNEAQDLIQTVGTFQNPWSAVLENVNQQEQDRKQDSNMANNKQQNSGNNPNMIQNSNQLNKEESKENAGAENKIFTVIISLPQGLTYYEAINKANPRRRYGSFKKADFKLILGLTTGKGEINLGQLQDALDMVANLNNIQGWTANLKTD